MFYFSAKSVIQKFHSSQNKCFFQVCIKVIPKVSKNNKLNIVSISLRQEGYMVKYSLSTREIPRAEIEGFPKCSHYISPDIPT